MYQTFKEQLYDHLNKTITIYTVGNHNRAMPYTGTLSTIHEDYITLILTTGLIRQPRDLRRHSIDFNRQFNNCTPYLIRPGSVAEIPIDKIASIVHYTF